MAIAEIFLSAFIAVIFEKLASRKLLQFFRVEGLDEKIVNWENDLMMIDAVLSDAEEKQITHKAVKLWLEELQDLAYDMDDILDELNTEASLRSCNHNEPESSTTSKILELFTPSPFFPRVSPKIDKINARLDVLTKRKNDLELIKSDRGRPNHMGQGSRATSSVVEESRVLGREKVKDEICKLLLEKRARNQDGEGCEVCVIPILGMGGLGKTTLAQLVYNDEQVKGHFDHRAWVCVSEDFDIFKISNLIYEAVAEGSKEFKDLNSVQVGLKEKLSNKKFLVVLDDVWDESYTKWDQFQEPFLVGAPESAIVVTTRMGSVAKIMGSMEAYSLEYLSENDCISLLARHALRKRNFDTRPDLKETGEALAKKCGGLPLAAKSLGGVLRTKTSLQQWQKVLGSKIWDLGTQSNLLPSLRLSYHHLPPHLKPLFVYCSIFPKDYEFKKDDLILLWMAEGLLTETEEDTQMEELGVDYFDEMLSRCFFQCSSGDESRFVMHDLVNDLAVFVSGKVCFRLDDKTESEMQSSFSEKVRHSSFILKEYGTYKMFKPYSKFRHLRTFLPIDVGNSDSFFLSNKVLNDLLPRLRCLRVLSLHEYMVNELPRSIGDLKHLRYLNMSHTLITELPESVCVLYNLQTLLLVKCNKLIQLPTSIRDLVNLRHLDIADTPKLKWMPAGIGMLSSLCTLSKIVVGERNGFQLTELKGLSKLKGTLSMFGMHNIDKAAEAREANLVGKGRLDKLEMIWNGNFEVFRDEDTEEQVLNALKPQVGLKSLLIEYYGGIRFPNWVGDRSFSCMVHLRLSGCKKCTSLPSLGHLLSLRELFIEGIDGVKFVGAEFYGDGGFFPSLETLSFKQMISWEEWSSNSIGSDENVNAVFPRLEKLSMVGCDKLVGVCFPRFQSLGELKIRECSEKLLRSMVPLASVKTLEFGAIAGLAQLDKRIISSFGAVEMLRVDHCGELRYLWEEEVACVVLTKLRELEVRDCTELVSLGVKEQVLPCNLQVMKIHNCESLEKIPSCCESLEKISISDCKKVRCFTSKKKQVASKTEKNKGIFATESSNSYTNEEEMEEGFPKLESLKVYDCASMKWLPTGKKNLPSTLKNLTIDGCENLEEPVEENWLLNGSSISSSLDNICIYDWAKLKSLREFFGFVHLTSLWIGMCEGIELIPERCLPPTLRRLHITKCKNLKSLKLYKEDVECLKELLITECKNLECYPFLGGGGGWPPNLEVLRIGDVKQPITEWGPHLHSLPPSLTLFSLEGEFPEMVTLSEVGISIPSSLKYLWIKGAVNLKSLSDDTLQNPTSLQQLGITNCPKVGSLPEMLLPTLSHLLIDNCPLMKERCRRKEKGDYWPLISHIPCINIDYKLEWGL